MTRYSALFALLLHSALLTSGFADDKKIESAYYPLTVGNTWKYTATGDQKITVTLSKFEKVGDEMCALLETKVGDNVGATEHIGVKEDGVYRYTFMGQKADPPVRIIKLPPKTGDTWKVQSSVGPQKLAVNYTMKEEKVEVPAGKFSAIVTETDEFMAGPVMMSAKIWYAKDVGMVKTVMKVAGQEVVLELEKFDKGTGK